MSLLSYSGLSTKLRAMSGKLLTNEDFRRISEMSTVADAAAYLKTKPTYAPFFRDLDEHNLHRRDIERTLSDSLYSDIRKVYRFANDRQRDCISSYTRMYEVDFLKRCLRHIFDRQKSGPISHEMLEMFENHSKLDMSRLETVSSLDEFLASLKDTPYYDAFSRLIQAESPSLFDYEMALDIYHFTSLWKSREKIAAGADLVQLTRIYGSKFDLLNIQWIKRAKEYYRLSPAQIHSFLIPVHYKLKKEDLLLLTEAEDLASFHAVLQNTYYGVHFQELTLETLEITYISVMKSILSRAAKNDPYSLASIFNYFYQKRHEITRLTIALECVRYGVAPEITMKRISLN